MAVREHRVAPDEWDHWVALSDGPQLVVAGPGTGKTEFLIRRVTHLIASEIARSDDIAIFCFSRRAAADFRRRISNALQTSGMPIESSTFHGFSLRLLEAGTGLRPIPLTTPEQIAVVAGLLLEERPEDWPPLHRGILAAPPFAEEIADFLMRCSERLLSPEDLAGRAEIRPEWRGIPRFFDRYRRRLVEMGRIDYGTLLVSAVEFLDTEAGRELASGYTHVLVDEYQDTSPAQAAIARLVSAASGNLTVAGDPYQSVYSFRGAEVRNVARFAEEHQGCLRLVLDRSFRVPAEIFDSALRVVSSGELPGAAGPVTPASHPGRVEAYTFDQETAEADWIASEVEYAIRADGVAPSDIAVLVRSKREMLNELSRAMERRRLPHDPPQRRLVDHPAIQFIHDLVTLAMHGGPIGSGTPGESAEADRAMRRVLLGPLFSTSLGRERQIARARRRSITSWPELIGADGGWPGLAGIITDPGWAVTASASDGFWELWAGLEAFRAVVTEDVLAPWRLALTSFSQALGRQTERDPSVTLAQYFRLTDDEDFEATPLISPAPPGQRVALTTLHQAKGLEFDLVFVANAVEGVFPDLRRSRRMLRPELLSPERIADGGAQHIFQIQEEMRLAYTAMTRARRRVVWTATDAGVDQGEHRPSRFLIAAAGVTGLDELGPPAETIQEPVTPAEMEARMRRQVLDPHASAADRLASLHVLANRAEEWDPMRFAGVPARGPDKPILPPGLRLSPSQADAYLNCPRKYALERRLRLGDTESPYAMFGSLVHRALEICESSVLGSEKVHAAPGDALKAVDEVWDEADFGTPELTEAWRRHAVAGVTKLYERWPGDGIPIALETRVESEIEGVAWRGVIDRLERTDEGLRVIDYKTGKSIPSVAEAAESVQLAFYCTAVSVRSGEGVVGAEMWFPRAGSVSVTVRKLDIDRLAELEAMLAAVTRSILAEDWSPRVNRRCGRCEFQLSCPLWPQGRGAFIP